MQLFLTAVAHASAWVFLHTKYAPLSASTQKNGNGFLGHKTTVARRQQTLPMTVRYLQHVHHPGINSPKADDDPTGKISHRPPSDSDLASNDSA